MPERPILFTGPMVNAIMDDSKKCTRRVINPQPKWEEYPEPCNEDHELWAGRYQHDRWSGDPNETPDFSIEVDVAKCPYGVPGDRLWVREAWSVSTSCHPLLWNSKLLNENHSGVRIWYRANNDRPTWAECRWRPSIFMPRWASRLTLEVTEIRVERLCDVTEQDAIAEGFALSGCGGEGPVRTFARLWDQINNTPKRNYHWSSNPWVWVVKFKRLEEE